MYTWRILQTINSATRTTGGVVNVLIPVNLEFEVFLKTFMYMIYRNLVWLNSFTVSVTVEFRTRTIPLAK